MRNITIKIWQGCFDDVFYADINGLADKYLSSEDLETLLNSIKIVVLEKIKDPE